MAQTDPFELLKSPNNLQGAVKDLQTKVATINRSNVTANTLGDLATNMGEVALAGGSGQITDAGMSLSADQIDIGFWASIGVPSNVVSFVYALVFSGTTLYVGGDFTHIGEINANYIAKYDIATGVWSNIGDPAALNGPVVALAVNGTDLYLGGSFTDAGGVANADYIAKWNGSAWSALGVTPLNNSVNVIVVDGSNIYVGGSFTNAGGDANADYIAKWNGSAWSALGTTPLNARVYTIAISGSTIYAGGEFTNAGGDANADYIAKWNGSAWSALGIIPFNNFVATIAINNSDVYAGGFFTTGGGVANADYIAKWNGSAWSALGLGMNGFVETIAINGTNIFVGGQFITAGGVTVNRIARWDGTAWNILGAGMDGDCWSFAFYVNDLYVGGSFTTAGGRTSKAIAAYLRSLGSVVTYLEVSGQAFQDEFYTNLSDTKDPTGWVDPTNINVSYSTTNRTITLTAVSGTLQYYWRGVKYDLGATWTSSAHTNADGSYYLASSDGTSFTWSTTVWTFDFVMVAKAIVSTTPAYKLALKETHGLMPWEVHQELHAVVSSYLVSGGTLTGGTYAENTATDAANTPGFDAAVIKDEDDSVTVPAWTQGTYTTMYIGASSKATFDTTATLPFRSSGSYILINNPLTGAETASTNNRYVNVYQVIIPATGDTDSQKYRMVMLQPQRDFASLALAQAEAVSSLSFGDLATTTPEFVVYARITYVLASGDANTGKCRIATGGITYITGSRLAQVSSTVTPSHNSLVGLQGGTTDEYYHTTSAQNTVIGNTSGTNTGDNVSIPNNGWIAATSWASLTRTSATVFTTTTDVSGVVGKRTKLKFTDTTTKYLTVVSAVFSAGVTTITTLATSDYALVGNPSAVYYSNIAQPFGWPDFFNYAITSSGGYSVGNGTIVAKYAVMGKLMYAFFQFTLGSTSTITGDFNFNAPATIANIGMSKVDLFDVGVQSYLGALDNTTTNLYARAVNVASTYALTGVLLSAVLPFTWGTGDFIKVAAWYEW